MKQRSPDNGVPKPIKDSSESLIVGGFCLGIFLYALLTFAFLSIKRGPNDRFATILFCYVIFFGVPLLPILASCFFIQWRKRFGRATLLLNGPPAQPGEEITGTLKVSRELADFDFIELRVKCLKICRSIYERHTTTLASNVSSVPREQIIFEGRETFIPIELIIPNCPIRISKGLLAPGIRWELQAEAKPHQGSHFVAEFKLPVAREEAESAHLPN